MDSGGFKQNVLDEVLIGEYDWTIHGRWQCGLSVKLLWPLVWKCNTKAVYLKKWYSAFNVVLVVSEWFLTWLSDSFQPSTVHHCLKCMLKVIKMQTTSWSGTDRQWIKYTTRMWANAQRDGRHAEYRWHFLVNAVKFRWRPLLEWDAVTLPRRETRWN